MGDQKEFLFLMDRIKELETALISIRERARSEQEKPTGLWTTCLYLIEVEASSALAGCDTYDAELELDGEGADA